MKNTKKRITQIMLAIMLALCAVAVNIRPQADETHEYVRTEIQPMFKAATTAAEAVAVVEPAEAEAQEETAEVKEEQPASELVAVNVFPEPTPEPVAEEVYSEPAYSDTSDGWTYYGVCTITHYCTGHCCNGPYTGTASGAPLTPYRTCASGQLPFGTEVLVNGEVWVVEDTGVQGMWLDLCLPTHEMCIQAGMYDAEIWIR